MPHIEEGITYKKEQTDQTKKNVLLIGDSIRLGYCATTKEALKDVANVLFPPENCRDTQYTFIGLSSWKTLFEDPEAVDCVYWNNGHWDVAHFDDDEKSLNTVETYAYMIGRIYQRIRTYFPNAKIVFATTMPTNPVKKYEPNPRTNEEIERYNKAALKALQNENVYIDDVFSCYKNRDSDFYEDYCHMTKEGFKELGLHVAEFIRTLL